jgi:hypothetical protein
VEVIDITVPVFTEAPSDATFLEGGPGFTLEWRATDQHPGNLYEIYVNNTLEFTGTSWVYNALISYSIFGLSKGDYNFKLVVYDSSMNNAADEVRINIIDVAAPSVIGYSDLEYVVGTTGNILEWSCIDNHPGSYIVYQDSTVHAGGIWSNSENITAYIDGLAVGEYNFTIVVSDDSGNMASDTVFVSVIEEDTDDSDDDGSNGNNRISGYNSYLILISFAIFSLLGLRIKRKVFLK